MRDIAGDFFARSPAMAGPVIALVIFFIVFVAVTLRVLRSRAVDWESDAALPLTDVVSDSRGPSHSTVSTEEPS